jgi:hypothetical protein
MLFECRLKLLMLLNLGIVGQAVLLFVQGQIGRTGQPEQRMCIALPFESEQPAAGPGRGRASPCVSVQCV